MIQILTVKLYGRGEILYSTWLNEKIMNTECEDSLLIFTSFFSKHMLNVKTHLSPPLYANFTVSIHITVFFPVSWQQITSSSSEHIFLLFAPGFARFAPVPVSDSTLSAHWLVGLVPDCFGEFGDTVTMPRRRLLRNFTIWCGNHPVCSGSVWGSMQSWINVQLQKFSTLKGMFCSLTLNATSNVS